jgi:farnesyl-diphosphate farnesyltransferase
MNTTYPFRLSGEEVSYLETWMNRVSRSFAVVVSVLEEPLKSYMAAAYILCRVIDNIEDCAAPIEWKKARFEEVSQLLMEPEFARDILASWDSAATTDWDGLTEDERNLMSSENGLPLWKIYSQFPDEVKKSISIWARQMVEGMSHLTDAAYPPNFIQHDGIQVLANYRDYDHYCYIVAGTVGNLATDLVIHHYNLSGSVADQLLQYSQACGRGLQKTNIVKDFCEDVSRGVCYLPDEWLNEVDYTPLFLRGASRDWNRKVLLDVMAELKDSTNYVLALPYEANGYRISSLLCLLPALQTILLAAQNHGSLFTAQHPTKIDHQTFGQCILDSRRLVNNNQAILEYYQQVEYQLNEALIGNLP